MGQKGETQGAAQLVTDPIANITPEGMSAFTPLFVQFLAWQRLMQINQTIKNYRVPPIASASASAGVPVSASAVSSSAALGATARPSSGAVPATPSGAGDADDPLQPSSIGKVRRRRRTKTEGDDFSEDYSPKPKRPRLADAQSEEDDLDSTIDDVDFARRTPKTQPGPGSSPSGVLGPKKKGRGRGRPRVSATGEDLEENDGINRPPTIGTIPATGSSFPPSTIVPSAPASSATFSSSPLVPQMSLPAPSVPITSNTSIPPPLHAPVPSSLLPHAPGSGPAVVPTTPDAPLPVSTVPNPSSTPSLNPRRTLTLRITDSEVGLDTSVTSFPFKIGRCKVREGEQPIDLNLARYSDSGETRKVSHLHCIIALPEDGSHGRFVVACKGRNGIHCGGQEVRMDETCLLGPDPVVLQIGPFSLLVETLL